MGSPAIPALSGPGYAISVWHPTQAAQILGLPEVAGGDPVRCAWDLHAILDSWINCVAALPWDLLNQPTPSRGRSLHDLMVNVFRPVEFLDTAWSEGTFGYDNGAADQELVNATPDAESLIRFAEGIQQRWSAFLAESADELGEDRQVTSPIKGDLPYSVLLDAQRLHAAQHLRQLVTFLESRGIAPATTLRLDQMPGLSLPPAIY